VVEARVTLKGDANLDGAIDVGDLGALATNYGLNIGGGAGTADLASPTAAIAGTASAASVPEPTSLGLFAAGAIGLQLRRRRRRAN
jgi:hypothetical protein